MKFSAKTASDWRVRSEAIEAIVVLLSPIAPHVTDLWSNLGHSQSLVDVSWPEVREDALARNTLTSWCK